MDRIAALVQELATELTEWLDLRFQLIELDVEQRLVDRRRQLLAYVCLAVSGAVAFLLIMVGASLALGLVFNSEGWGFLLVGTGLGLSALGTYLILRRRFANGSQSN